MSIAPVVSVKFPRKTRKSSGIFADDFPKFSKCSAPLKSKSGPSRAAGTHRENSSSILTSTFKGTTLTEGASLREETR